MPIQISKAMRKKLPDTERDTIEESLKAKANGTCFLCEYPLNYASEIVLPDHDLPEKEGGPTELANLNLAHRECNAFKRNHSSIDARPYLKFQRFLHDRGQPSTYADCIAHFTTTLGPCNLSIKANKAKVSAPDGTVFVAPIFSEKVGDDVYEYAFVPLPKSAIYNDEECQPRTVKPQHVWSLFLDLKKNPLHEPPGCRLKETDQVDMYKIVMFDGQHKSIASWLHDLTHVTVKLYLNINREQTVRLVNSVQKLIKKLPLSPFELAAKMSEEWQDLADRYETDVGTAAASEAGFVKWIGKDDRTRARNAFKDALYQSVYDDPNLELRKYIKSAGNPLGRITEAACRNKLLKPLLHLEPLTESFTQGQALRGREQETIVRLMNLFTRHAFDPAEKKGASDRERERARRMSYQSSLQHIAGLLRGIVGHRLVSLSPRELLDKAPSAVIWKKVEDDIKRLVKHPIWEVDLETNDLTNAVKDALSKNQDAKTSFHAVQVMLGYCVGVDKLDNHLLT